MLSIRKCGHRELDKYYSVFGIDFDSEELISKMAIHKGLLTGKIDLMIFTETETGEDVGYAIILSKGLYGYLLLKYFAIFPWCRKKGYGKAAMEMLCRTYNECQGILVEITDFPDHDPEHQKKLYRFFAQFGFVNVDSDYRIGGTKANVMVKPVLGTEQIKTVLHRIIQDLYSQILTSVSMNRMIDIKLIR